MGDTVHRDKVADVVLQLCSHAILLVVVNRRAVTTQEDRLVVPLLDASPLEHWNRCGIYKYRYIVVLSLDN